MDPDSALYKDLETYKTKEDGRDHIMLSFIFKVKYSLFCCYSVFLYIVIGFSMVIYFKRSTSRSSRRSCAWSIRWSRAATCWRAAPSAWSCSPNKAGRAPTASSRWSCRSRPRSCVVKRALTLARGRLTPTRCRVPNAPSRLYRRCMKRTVGTRPIPS